MPEAQVKQPAKSFRIPKLRKEFEEGIKNVFVQDVFVSLSISSFFRPFLHFFLKPLSFN